MEAGKGGKERWGRWEKEKKQGEEIMYPERVIEDLIGIGRKEKEETEREG